ncbi:MAG: alpha-galactosidase [Clostridiales bacterium]|nr:alpha-galactosidase [Clostridiales bacterium]
MSIIFYEKEKIFKLDTSDTSYVIKIYDENYLLNLYYGKKIPDVNFKGFEKRLPSASFSPSNPVIGEHGFSPDSAPIEYGCNGAGDFRISALSVRNANGDNVTDIRYVSHKIYAGKKPIPSLPSTYANTDDEAQILEITTEDKVTGLQAVLVYTVFENCPVMTRSIRLTNPTDKPMHVERVFSLCLDLPSMYYDMITLYGRHCCERNIQRRPLAHGVQGVESKRGVSGHSQNPFAAIVSRGADEDHGEAYGFNLVYSGNFSALAECDHNGTTRFIMGINPEGFEWFLDSGETFYSPEAVSVYTDKGIGEMSRIFHRFYNSNLIRGKYKTQKRPLLINSWEAAYFDFDTEKLVAFAESAKELGIEMLVMDDGWFGKRNCDNSSLGDWFVNEEKLPGGLKPLIERINQQGLKFGIWYEPEMISPDSDLFRAQPDWQVHVRDREPMIGRNQYVLDVSREDVRENIWGQIYKVLSENKIDYVKWDFNRNISDAGSALLPPERSKEFFHRFILGTYDLLNRLTTAFPDILLEGCSGGGGRFDPAMLAFSPQIWTSDNTDPIERLYIQFGTSMCYPASAQGAHVSACDRTGYKTKGDVAMWGTFGYELDPRKLTPEDREIVKNHVASYHKYYDLIRGGDLYRLISPFENSRLAAWQIVAGDKSSFLFTMVCMLKKDNVMTFVKFKGLDENARYKNEADGEIYSGAFLMNVGLNLTGCVNRDGESFTAYFTQV